LTLDDEIVTYYLKGLYPWELDRRKSGCVFASLLISAWRSWWSAIRLLFDQPTIKRPVANSAS